MSHAESEQPTDLRDQLDPYLDYCEGDDTGLAIALWGYAQQYGGPGRPGAPADHGPDYHCPTCEVDVRGTSGRGEVLVCPLCGEVPGLEAIGLGPKGEIDEQ